MKSSTPCKCSQRPKLIFSCSGAADVGAVADKTARQLTRDGVGKMYCLAGIGGRVPQIMETTAQACAILAIDGCPVDCVKHCLEKAGFENFHHFRITDLGFEKGSTPPAEENVSKSAEHGARMLQC